MFDFSAEISFFFFLLNTYYNKFFARKIVIKLFLLIVIFLSTRLETTAKSDTTSVRRRDRDEKGFVHSTYPDQIVIRKMLAHAVAAKHNLRFYIEHKAQVKGFNRFVKRIIVSYKVRFTSFCLMYNRTMKASHFDTSDSEELLLIKEP